MPDLAKDPEYRLTLRQADQARENFSIILDELDFVKAQLSGLPMRVAHPDGVVGWPSAACGCCSG